MRRRRVIRFGSSVCARARASAILHSHSWSSSMVCDVFEPTLMLIGPPTNTGLPSISSISTVGSISTEPSCRISCSRSDTPMCKAVCGPDLSRTMYLKSLASRQLEPSDPGPESLFCGLEPRAGSYRWSQKKSRMRRCMYTRSFSLRGLWRSLGKSSNV